MAGKVTVPYYLKYSIKDKLLIAQVTESRFLGTLQCDLASGMALV